MLFNLRANTVNGFKMCFKSAYIGNEMCNLGCASVDSLSHIFSCEELNKHIEKTHINLNTIYASIDDQKEAVSEFILRQNIRVRILESDVTYQG